MTEPLPCGSRQQIPKCIISSLRVNDIAVEKSQVIKYLGIWVDRNLFFKHQITVVCQKAMVDIIGIRNIRNTLTLDACKVLMLGLALCYLDYCNAIYYGLPEVYLNRLQCVQNIAAKVVLQKSKHDSVNDCLKTLHWLPVKLHINFKILWSVYKSLNDQAQECLQNLLILQPYERNLRSTTVQ